jgi:hypothetical protein
MLGSLAYYLPKSQRMPSKGLIETADARLDDDRAARFNGPRAQLADFDRLLRIVTRFTLSLPPEGSILAL